MKTNFDKALWATSREKIKEVLGNKLEYGLSENEVRNHREKFGSNVIAKGKQKSLAEFVVEGIKEPMILLLFAVAIFSMLFGKFLEATVMIFVVAAYILVELLNKYRADRVMQQLEALAAPTARVKREGEIRDIKTEDVVVGDILILSEGVVVPADARLLTAYGLLVDESSLTGESMPVTKDADLEVAVNASLIKRRNCVFSGTMIVTGEGTALVFVVGEESEFGKIAQQVQTTEKETTLLQESMRKLAKVLAIFAICISIAIPLIGFFQGLGLEEMILTWLSLTFLMIPGQPPIIITMALATAAFALAKKKVIVKRLKGVEVLGQVTSIVSDKTGTITESKMVLDEFITPGEQVKQLPHDLEQKIHLALPDFSSDPTDKAVTESVTTKKELKQIGFSGFSENKPWRDIKYKKDDKVFHAIAGSPEALLSGAILGANVRQELEELGQQEARAGKRVVAYAWIENESLELEFLKNINFLALAILKDPVRPKVKEAIAILEKAQVPTIIVTGDHKSTARAVALEVGISKPVETGETVSEMSDDQLGQILESSSIFARMEPLEKVRLVKILQNQKEIVAVIGDGVNDGPALKAAQVGIAMGQIGTDLAREVSDLILTDDNFAHLADAIAIGRRALENFQKGLTYYLSAKVILLAVFLVPLLLGIPFPFAPIQIIFIELLMDLASSTIFVTEEGEPDIMKKAAPNMQNFLSRKLVFNIIGYSWALAIGIMIIYLRTYYFYDVTTAQTAAFVTWLLGHILLAFNMKQKNKPLFIQGFFSNFFAMFWLIMMVFLSLIVTFIPWFYPYLKTTWLSGSIWISIVFIVILSTFWIEAKKVIVKFMLY